MTDLKLSGAGFSETRGMDSGFERASVSSEDAKRFEAIMERSTEGQRQSVQQHAGQQQRDQQGLQRSDARPQQSQQGLQRSDAQPRNQQSFQQADSQLQSQQDFQQADSQLQSQQNFQKVDSQLQSQQGFQQAEVQLQSQQGLQRQASETQVRDSMSLQFANQQIASSERTQRSSPLMGRTAGENDLETGGLKNRDLFGSKETAGDTAAQEASKSMQSLFHDFAMPEFTMAEAAPAETVASGTDVEAMEGLVDRILVSAPDKGSPEVRLMVNSDVLKDTEISLVRDITGQLTVKINSSDPNTLQTLVASRNDLQQMLQARESQNVRIEMNADTSAGNESDPRQRSRGLDDNPYQKKDEA